MEAKEMRLGNFIKSKTTNLFRVDQLSLTNNQGYVARMYFNKFRSYMDLPVSMAEPIPLTEELILKLGFGKDIENVLVHKSGVSFDLLNECKSSKYRPCIDCMESPIGIGPDKIVIRALSLHDLQNKFFAITGKELDTTKAITIF